MPFLRITPDAKASGMGETGVATTPDLNSLYWNNAKLAFLGGDYGGSIGYTPWLSTLKAGITSMYATGFRKLDESQVISIAMNYFTLGQVNYYDELSNAIGSYNPNELSVEIGYGRQISPEMGLGITAKYLHSDLAIGSFAGAGGVKPAADIAFDIGWYYEEKEYDNTHFSYGAFLSNIGPKLKQTFGSESQFLPMNLRLGTQYHVSSDQNDNSMNFSLDINKLLVPTPPIYQKDANGNETNIILRGSSPNKSVPGAIFGSFSDAPNGFSQNMEQFTVGLGGEYIIQNKVSLRSGYHFESASLGDMRYFTFGLGYTAPTMRIDCSYIAPLGQANPYKNTFRITLGFNVLREN